MNPELPYLALHTPDPLRASDIAQFANVLGLGLDDLPFFGLDSSGIVECFYCGDYHAAGWECEVSMAHWLARIGAWRRRGGVVE